MSYSHDLRKISATYKGKKKHKFEMINLAISKWIKHNNAGWLNCQRESDKDHATLHICDFESFNTINLCWCSSIVTEDPLIPNND